jgi:hypothetical protein
MTYPALFAYRLGLVAQLLTEAGPRGLTRERLARRTRLRGATIDDVLRVALERRHARREGARYFAACCTVPRVRAEARSGSLQMRVSRRR